MIAAIWRSPASFVKSELHYSAAQLGFLLTAFFWTYTALMFPSRWPAYCLNVNWVLAGGFVLWSLATSATALVHGFVALMVARMSLGAGESWAFPCVRPHPGSSRRAGTSRRRERDDHVGHESGAGDRHGTGCGIPTADYGWRPVFFAVGLVSLLWIVPWMRWMPDDGVVEDRTTAPVSAFDILRTRSFWGAAIGHFGGTYAFYFILLWLPFYLVGERHLSMRAMAFEAAWFYIAYAAAAPVGGWIGDIRPILTRCVAERGS